MNTYPGVVSMYSFKGGAGRTVCAANLAKPFAENLGATAQQPIVLLDMDVDSAGLTVLLEKHTHFENARYTCSKLLTGEVDLCDQEQIDGIFAQGMVDVSDQLGAEKGTIRFLGTEIVGRRETTYISQKAAERMLDFLDCCAKRRISGVLIDSASGRQETALVCHSIADVIVYCCRLSRQFIYGTSEQLKRHVEFCREETRPLPAIVLLPVAVPEAKESLEPIRNQRIIELLKIERDLPQEMNFRVFESGIGEVQSFKWIESILHVRADLSPDETDALQAYLQVAHEICNVLHSKRNQVAI
jgi:cellulose biosynthesis protein BcsQ